MLETAKEDYKTTESYALFTTIVCWVMQRARTPANRNRLFDKQAQEVGIALQGSRISSEPWSLTTIPDMTAFDFFISIRNAVAHGDGRQIRPWNENGVLVGQIIPIVGQELRLCRVDMRRLGCSLAHVFCDTMAKNEQEGNLHEAAAQQINPSEEAMSA